MLRDWPSKPICEGKQNAGRQQAIPTTLYQTWEENLFGRTHKRSLLRFRRVNGDLSFIFLDRSARDDYMAEAWGDHDIFQIYTKARFGAMKVDIFRYCILFDRGGYYFDISKGTTVPITSLHTPEDTEIISFEKNEVPLGMVSPSERGLLRPNNLFIQWGFGFAPQHGVLDNVITLICENYQRYKGKVFENPKAAILEFTGPVAFTRSVWNFIDCARGDLHVVDFDFDGRGIYSMRGSGARFKKFPSYATSRNAQIVD